MQKKELPKIKSEIFFTVNISYSFEKIEDSDKIDKLVEKVEKYTHGLSYKTDKLECETSIGGSAFNPYIILSFYSQQKLTKIVKKIEDYIEKLGGEVD